MRQSLFCILGLAALVGFFVAGCDSSGNAGADNFGDYAEASRWVDDLAAVLCDLNAQCCAPHGLTPTSDCLTKAKTQLHREFDKEMESGSRFDRQAAAACMSAYRSLAPACPTSYSTSACRGVLVSNQPSGPCSRGCAPSDAGNVICVSYSSSAADGAVTESGQICQLEIVVPPGASCDSFGHAAVERHCDRTMNSSCIVGATTTDGGTGGICSTAKPIGAACLNPSSYTTECAPEAYCAANKICTARIAIGGACSEQECAVGASCDTGKCIEATRWRKSCSGDFD